MSKARSPREVCSTTIGTSGLIVLASFACRAGFLPTLAMARYLPGGLRPLARVRNPAPPRDGTGGWLARTQEATRSSAARADEDEARRRQGRLEWRPIYDSGH